MNTFVTLIAGLLTTGTLSSDVQPKPALSVPPLAGTVVDEESGRPLEGIIVRLETSGSPRAWPRTDAAGRYAFQDGPPITYGMMVTVRALHPLYGMSARTIQPACGGARPYDPSEASCTQEVGFSLRSVGLSLRDSAPYLYHGRAYRCGRPSRQPVTGAAGEWRSGNGD